MAPAGATFPIDTDSSDGQHFLIVEMRYHSDISDQLLEGVGEALEAAGASYDLVIVPGLLEIPTAVAMAVEAGDYDGVIALGTFTHLSGVDNTYLLAETTRALVELSVVDALPLAQQLISFESEQQAHIQGLAKIHGVIGAAAARSALAMAALKVKLNA